MYITLQQIVLFFSVMGGVTVFIGYIFSASKWLQKQESIKKDINNLYEEIELIKRHHDDDILSVRREEVLEFKEIKTELQLLTYSVLACLKCIRDTEGFMDSEKIKDAINTIEKHINEKAHH